MNTRTTHGALFPLLLALSFALQVPERSARGDSYRQRRGKRTTGQGYRRRAGAAKSAPPPPYLLLARKAVIAGNVREAVRQLTRARRCWARVSSLPAIQRRKTCGFSGWAYRLVAGIVYLERGQPLAAIRSLEASLKAKADQPTAWLYLGQALYCAERYSRAAVALRRGRRRGRDRVDYHLLLARALERGGKAEAARGTLAAALRRFPRERRLKRELASSYAAQGLYLTAATIAGGLLVGARGVERRTLALMVADYLRRGGQRRRALALLERTRLAFPHDARVLLRLAYTYADAEQPLVAARLAARVAVKRPDLAFFVAEQYRIAGRTERALSWNAAIGARWAGRRGSGDEAKGGRHHRTRRRQLRQRATILLGAQAWQRAAEVLAGLLRSGQLGDRGRYQLAYAALKARRLGLARRALTALGQTPTTRRLWVAWRACKRDSTSCP